MFVEPPRVESRITRGVEMRGREEFDRSGDSTGERIAGVIIEKSWGDPGRLGETKGGATSRRSPIRSATRSCRVCQPCASIHRQEVSALCRSLRIGCARFSFRQRNAWLTHSKESMTADHSWIQWVISSQWKICRWVVRIYLCYILYISFVCIRGKAWNYVTAKKILCNIFLLYI